MPRLQPRPSDHTSSTARSQLAGVVDRDTTIPRPLDEKISLALQVWIDGDPCIATHMAAARAAGLTDSEIAPTADGYGANIPGRDTTRRDRGP